MQELLAIASLLLFAALAIAFFSVLARAGRVVADTRVEDAFRRDSAGLAERAIDHLGEVAARIDRVRRRLDPPELLDEILPPALEALEGLAVEVGSLVPPPELTPLRDRLADELGRASRAAETIRHGGVLLGVTAGRPRELEGETAIKRGYLNLMHAREALQELAADLRSGRVDARRWFSDRHGRSEPAP